MAVGGQRHAQTAFPTGERDPVPVFQEAGLLLDPGWTGVENLVSTGVRAPDRPIRSELQYRQRCPFHFFHVTRSIMRSTF